MPDTILVTEKEFLKGESVFLAAPGLRAVAAPNEEAPLAEAVRECGVRAVILGNAKCTGPLYEALAANAAGAPALMARFGVGHDGVDKALARRHGIFVTNTPNVLEVSVAETTMFLIGALTRLIARCDAEFRAGQFVTRMGVEMRGKTLGLIGFGAIGRQVAAIAHFGFGMRVIAAGASSPETLARREGRPLLELLASLGVEHYTDNVDAILREADFVSLHIPSNPQTRHLINASRLAAMRPGARLVNTSRGAVLDELALYDALAEGRLAGAALDVFEREPYVPLVPDKDLRTLQNVLLTPHIGSNTREANTRMAETALANAVNFLSGNFEKLNRVDL